MQSLFLIIIVVLFSSPVAYGTNLVSLVNKEGEYTYVSPVMGDVVLAHVVAAFEAAKYTHQDPMVHLPKKTKSKVSTWCKVTADSKHQIVGECSALLHPGHCAPVTGFIKPADSADYSQVPKGVEQLRQKYHACQRGTVHS